MRRHLQSNLRIVCFVAACAGLSAQRARRLDDLQSSAQWNFEPSIVVGDMLLRPEQLRDLTSDPTDSLRPQAHSQVTLGARVGLWDFGVIPYEIAPGFSPAERQRILDRMALWSRLAPVIFVPRTTQTASLAVTKDDPSPTQPSPCFSNVGQPGRGFSGRTNLGGTCATDNHGVAHELGHALALLHEQQRADRDDYITIDFSNIGENARFAFDRLNFPLIGPYDFGSIMHYHRDEFALDRSRATILPLPRYESFAATMGRLPDPSQTDHDVLALLYNAQLHESNIRMPTEATRTRFDRADLLLAMERLHAFYMSRYGLQRPQGLSINGRPDFLGIAQWIFDIYLAARSGGFSAEGAFDIVTAAITQTEEWRQKNPGRTPLTPASFRAIISFSRDEFLDVLNRLDRFYAAPEGLQRPDGLSIAGGPDFLGIATWIFDIYLNQRLSGASPTATWVLTENAIRNTDEWRRKH